MGLLTIGIFIGCGIGLLAGYLMWGWKPWDEPPNRPAAPGTV